MISYFTLRPYIKTKRSINILNLFVIPLKSTNANLKSNKFVNNSFHLFVALFSSIILMTELLETGIIP